MTKKEKMILAFLFGFAVLLNCGFAFLISNPEAENPEIEIEVPEPIIGITVMIPTEKPEDPVTIGRVVTVTPVPVIEENLVTAAIMALEPSPSSIPKRHAENSKPKQIGSAFQMEILGKAISIADNVDEASLEKTPGWLPTSAKPGEEGTCVIYGHRNRNHLQIIKDIRIGDEIVITVTRGATFKYSVCEIKILEPGEAIRMDTVNGKQLMIVTCYPFYYSGHAPQKKIIIGTMTVFE
ncbi:MAG: class D sortase [Clostridia bacterium]|nr:class D sortase [Clostridia bacterium]